MTTRINPPTFNKEKNYERFKQELLAWKEITDLRQDKQGIAIALSLPEEDESKICEKVFDQIPLDDLKSEDGFTVLLNFLDQHLAKDDLSDSLEKFEDFEDFKRAEGQSINEYVATFDAKYRKVEKKKMTLRPGFYTKFNVWGSLGLNFDYEGGPIIENGGPIFIPTLF